MAAHLLRFDRPAYFDPEVGTTMSVFWDYWLGPCSSSHVSFPCVLSMYRLQDESKIVAGWR